MSRRAAPLGRRSEEEEVTRGIDLCVRCPVCLEGRRRELRRIKSRRTEDIKRIEESKKTKDVKRIRVKNEGMEVKIEGGMECGRENPGDIQ